METRPVVEDVARAALAAVDSDIALILVAQFVGERYADLAARTPLRALHRVGTLRVPGVVTAGTITVTRDATTVAGDATAAAAWSAEPESVVGRFFQAQTAWYRILSVTPGALRIEPFAEDSVATGGYRIVPRYHCLPPDVRTLGTFTHASRRRELRAIGLADLDAHAPGRSYTASGPEVVVDLGVSAAQERIVELYPYAPTSTLVRFDYWAEPPRLTLTDPLPGAVDVHMLKEGVLVDIYRHMAARAAKGGDFNGAGYWRNEARAQETRWEGYVAQALLNDRGLDDVETRLRSSQGVSVGRDITTAHDEIWARGRG